MYQIFIKNDDCTTLSSTTHARKSVEEDSVSLQVVPFFFSVYLPYWVEITLHHG